MRRTTRSKGAFSTKAGSSRKFQYASGGATVTTSMRASSVGMSSVVIRIGGPVKCSRLFRTPAVCPTDPPARIPKLRSVRR